MMQCPVCRRDMPVENVAFCPYCGTALPKADKNVPEEIRRLLDDVQKQKDPVQKHQLLTAAQDQYPDSLEIAQEILFLGRLYERSAKKLDYSVIKCYLWHMYLTPEQFSTDTKNAMREELVNHPHLQKCLSLAPDADIFMRQYLTRLAAEFVRVFLMGSTHYTKTLFGFRLDSRMGRVLAQPAAQMLCAIREDEQLDVKNRALLFDALYRAFVAETGGESQWVDALLEQKGYPVPSKG
ncbi:MAG: hypothetical protein IKK75_06830 [Clostridia bacterium]|nr:hypothetical protein [Clostridia bacterium]